MKLNQPLYAAIKDGRIVSSYESIIIGQSIDEVQNELDSWSFMWEGKIDIVPIMLVRIDNNKYPFIASGLWTKEEAERRKTERPRSRIPR